MVTLCIDYGDRYVGLAATDIDGKVPYRYGTIDQKTEDALERIRNIVLKERITHVLVGIPVNLEGEETEQTHKTLAFLEDLREALPESTDIEGVDETLTSVEARRVIEREGAVPDDEHAEAARLMLVSHLQAGIDDYE